MLIIKPSYNNDNNLLTKYLKRVAYFTVQYSLLPTECKYFINATV